MQIISKQLFDLGVPSLLDSYVSQELVMLPIQETYCDMNKENCLGNGLLRNWKWCKNFFKSWWIALIKLNISIIQKYQLTNFIFKDLVDVCMILFEDNL